MEEARGQVEFLKFFIHISCDILSDSDWKTSHEADSCGSCFSKMDQRQAKLVAEPTWSAHADWPNVSGGTPSGRK